MAHYAFINSENIVVEVITGIDEDDTSTLPEEFESWEDFYASMRDGLTCKRTSYNTSGNTHQFDGTPFRGNYAGIGFTYDPVNDVFYGEQPYPSWTISADSNWSWISPIPYPEDENSYEWNEETQSWDLVE